LIVTEHRFRRTPDGRVWSSTFGDAAYWLSQAHPFRDVTVVGRVKEEPCARPEWARADSATVAVAALPSYLGPTAFVRAMPALWWRLFRQAKGHNGMVLTSCPSILGTIMGVLLKAQGRRCLVTVICDPKTLYCRGAVRHVLRWFFGVIFLLLSKWQVRNAAIVRYVTAGHLQRQVPPNRGQSVYAISDAVLAPEVFAPAPRRHPGAGKPLLLISVGALDQVYKGHNDLLEALTLCDRQGVRLQMEVFGEGKHLPELQSLAAKLGLSNRVRFRGGLSRPQLLRELSGRGDVFVLPSKTEGLPRALLEAMAKGMPCLGTRVGGIPELLPDEALFNPGDPVSLGQKLLLSSRDPEWLNNLAAKCLARAHSYARDGLAEAQERMMTEYSRLFPA
jgi:glycosyltransferase involved in cell wall biosynthesis